MQVPDLDFSKKYDLKHSEAYFYKHQDGWSRRLTTLREVAMARQGLLAAGNPDSVLDLPCGTGRFWDLLAEHPQRKIYASDLNQPMLEVAMKHRPAHITARVEAFQGSAFNIPKPDNLVKTVFCIRLLHHIGKPEDRRVLLKELRRVASEHVIVSLWLDGNYKAWRRRKRDEQKKDSGEGNRHVIPRTVIEPEFAAAGLQIVKRIQFLPFYSMWSLYVLRKI